ncbi:hypothetical protein [Lysinibacillus fusiformis]|uniref:hypothetical protein n=1 Tax=Lysinibacillus fusiformis TaxID=28031 RepID=UPI0035C03B73|nr:hypothetical protein QYY55_23510 [Lysinibacillus fusiformis]
MDILKSINAKATPEDLLPTITPKYTLEMLSFGGEDHLKAEGAAVVTRQQTASSAEKVAAALMQIAEAWGASMEELQIALMMVTGNVGISTSMTAEELAIALECIEPHEQVMKQVHKLCLKRPHIIHQVSNRQPRNRVNKIIR